MNPSSENAVVGSPLRHVRPFIHLLAHHFTKDAGLQHVAALTYTTLLSLVPLMTVMLALFSVFPASDRLADQIENFLFQNFVPAAGEAVQAHLRDFSQKAGRLTGVGFAFLILVALLLMSNIDKAFNAIWHVRQKRSPVAKFTVYWAILSLGPLLIAFSVGVTSYLVSIPLFSDGETVLLVRSRMLSMMPVVISACAFTLLYALVPNRPVPLRHAITGGVLAAFLFELAKRGFALFVTTFPTYETIYGALAAVPIFLIWIYLSWFVTLLGAEFTYCLGVYREDWHQTMELRGGEFMRAFRLLKRLRQAQHMGVTLSAREMVEQVESATHEQVETSLQALATAHLVLRDENRRWALARDLNEVSLSDLYHSANYALPPSRSLKGESEALQQMMGQLENQLDETMKRPLADLMQET
ncbi:MAG: virulence factor BrkB family protein [Candidatus Thiodiazotropha sp. (ex Monitilora ramsayi)]|nr:virulence factor BrkB family protein [Candidatus Thiodiazotropha sp. (ex Monitilora ramsayi)]